MASLYIKLPTAHVGAMRTVIATLISASTKHDFKKYRAGLFGWLRTIRGAQMIHYKAEDLHYIREVFDAKTLDTYYEFWYDHNRDENEGATINGS